jgi:hypothetical protein
MTYELPDFPIGIVYKSDRESGVINCAKFESKDQLMIYLNQLMVDNIVDILMPNFEITIYKKTIEYDPELKKDREVCRFHKFPKTVG